MGGLQGGPSESDKVLSSLKPSVVFVLYQDGTHSSIMPMTRQFTRICPRYCRHYSTIRPPPQWISQAPETTCCCQPMPPGLDIDHDSKMTFSPYSKHLVVCTGQNDWASKIELDFNTGPVTRHLKSLLGPPGKRGAKVLNGVLPGKHHDVRTCYRGRSK
jgi:hypothetical protein